MLLGMKNISRSTIFILIFKIKIDSILIVVIIKINYYYFDLITYHKTNGKLF